MVQVSTNEGVGLPQRREGRLRQFKPGTVAKWAERFRAEGAMTHSVVMRSHSMTTRWIEAEHNFRFKPR